MVSIGHHAAVPVPDDARATVSELYRRHWLGLVRLAVLVVDDRQSAEDVVQEAFTELYRRWPLKDSDKALGYLRTAVLNRSRSVLRRRRVARPYTPPAELPNGSAESAVLWGWNKDGIWLAEDYNVKAQPMVWKPGSAQPTQLTVADFDLGLVAPAGTDKVLVTTRRGESWCLKVGTLQGNKLDFQRQYCGEGGRAIYPVLSPDGRTMIHSELKIAIDVETGKVTKLELGNDELHGFPQPIFEDATHLLTMPTPAPSERTPATPTAVRTFDPGMFETQTVQRCDVTTGSCKLLYTTPADTGISLVNP